jgi:hypothetical protein
LRFIASLRFSEIRKMMSLSYRVSRRPSSEKICVKIAILKYFSGK